MDITTVAVPFTGNRGSSSMLWSIIQNMSKKIESPVFNVYTYYPAKEKPIYAGKNIRVLDGTPINFLFYLVPVSFLYFLFKKIGIKLPGKILGKGINTMLKSDLYLAVGGTTFSDAKLLKVVFNVLCLLPAIFLGVKLVLFTQTMGPFKNIFNRTMAKLFLPHARLIIGRGKGSYENLKMLNLKNIDYAPDAAYSLTATEYETKHIEEKYKPLFDNKIVVGLSPNSIVEGFCKKAGIDHAKIYGEFINYLIDTGYLPVIIPHSMKLHSKNRHNNDLPVIEDILIHVKEPQKLIYVKEEYSYIEIRKIIGMMDFYVASRFHSMISATYQKTPVLVFGWGYQKYKEIIDEFKLNDYIFDFKNITLSNLIEGFNKLVQNKETIKSAYDMYLPKVIEKSDRVYELIMGELEN